MYYSEGIKRQRGARRASKFMDDGYPRSNPTEGTSMPYRSSKWHPTKDADGLNAVRGLRNALILEILALGLGWAIWHFAPLLAAWWRAQ